MEPAGAAVGVGSGLVRCPDRIESITQPYPELADVNAYAGHDSNGKQDHNIREWQPEHDPATQRVEVVEGIDDAGYPRKYGERRRDADDVTIQRLHIARTETGITAECFDRWPGPWTTFEVFLRV